MSKLNLFKKDNDVCIKEALTEENTKKYKKERQQQQQQNTTQKRHY